MTETSWPYVNQPNTDIEYSRLAREFQDDGTIGSYGDGSLKVTADGAAFGVTVAPGALILRGYQYRNFDPKYLTVATADSQPRIDRLIAELNVSLPTAAERIQIKILKGTPAAVPVAPPLTQQESGIYQFSLARFPVPAGATIIDPVGLVDERAWGGLRILSWANDAGRPAAPRKYQIGFNVASNEFEWATGSTPAWKPLAPSFISAGIINSGTLDSARLPIVPIAKGGTGADNAASARTNLAITPANIGAATASHNHDFTQVRVGAGDISQWVSSNFTNLNDGRLWDNRNPHGHDLQGEAHYGILQVNKGGTGGTTKSAARSGIGIFVQSTDPSTGMAAGDLRVW